MSELESKEPDLVCAVTEVLIGGDTLEPGGLEPGEVHARINPFAKNIQLITIVKIKSCVIVFLSMGF